MVTSTETKHSISALRNRRFSKAREVLQRITDILVHKYGVARVVLIGSLTDMNRFGFHSDIDLCVEGLSGELYFKAVGEVLLEADEFEVDLIPIEDATPKMKERIRKGRVLYDKGRAFSEKSEHGNPIRT